MTENTPVDPYEDDEPQLQDGQVVGTHSPMLSNSTYNTMKWVALILLPAIASAYFALSQTLGLPYGTEVVGTITIIDTFLGAVLGFSNKSYVAETQGPTVGFMNVSETADGKKVDLEFPGDPHDIDQFDKVTFKVRKLN